MEITEVRIKLMNDPQERLQAFCSITFDACFVIRDLKIIEGTKGSFVAMPSRKLMDRCSHCGMKNHLRSQFCNQCGNRLPEFRANKDDDGRSKLYADIAHPINSRCREMIQTQVIKAFHEEVERAKLPGYICTYDDYGEDNFADPYDYEDIRPAPATFQTQQGTHRIDPVENVQPGPHKAPVEAPREVIRGRRSDSAEEGFGSGIL